MLALPQTPTPTPLPWRRALAAWIAVSAAVAILDPLSRPFGWIHANIGGIAALLFLLVPGRIAPAGHPLWDPIRLAWVDGRRSIAHAAVAIAATAALFPVAFHLHATVVRGEAAAWSASALLRPAERFHGTPATRQPNVIHVYDNAGQITVTLASPSARTIRVSTDGSFAASDGESPESARTASTLPPARPATVRVVPRDADTVRIELVGPASSDVQLRAGAAARLVPPAADGSWTVRLGLGWLLSFVLVHLALVAFPEEFFYRAMILPALAATPAGARSLRVGPLTLTLANVATSALFAVAHFVVGLEPSRLAVFFPSLVFGFLRERSGSIAGAIVYHAFCNVLLQLLSLQYLSS